MISRGDLVKMCLTIGGESGDSRSRELIILGRVLNYSEEEESYILEPKAISVPKSQVAEIERLPEDFDFDDVSLEIRLTEKELKREKPSEIDHIRFARKR